MTETSLGRDPRFYGRPAETVVVRPQLTASGNYSSTILQAAGSIIVSDQEALPAFPIPEQEIRAISLAWVSNGSEGEVCDTVGRLLHATRSRGFAVIGGGPGDGKRGTATRALWEESEERRKLGKTRLTLMQVTPDWERFSKSLLPKNDNTGYLLDFASDAASWRNPQSIAGLLLEYGHELQEHGSCAIAIVNQRDWHIASLAEEQVYVGVKARPSPMLIVTSHLRNLYGSPERADWMGGENSRNGELPLDDLAALIKNETYPADASKLALALSEVDPNPEALKSVIGEFQAWRVYLKERFAGQIEDVSDRAIVIAAAVLETASAVDVNTASRELIHELPDRNVKAILAAPDLKSRYESLGVGLKAGNVSFDARPGVGLAILQHVWSQRPDFHEFLLSWIRQITKPTGIGASIFDAVGRKVVDLAISSTAAAISSLTWWDALGVASNMDAAACRSCVCEDNKIAGGCCCQDRGCPDFAGGG